MSYSEKKFSVYFATLFDLPLPFSSDISMIKEMTYQDPRNGSAGGIGKMPSSLSPHCGKYVPNNLKALYYGPQVVKMYLLSCLASESSKAFIVTGSSLATKTPVVKELEAILSPKHHAATFSGVTEHSPQYQINEGVSMITKDESIDTIISVGGGSPMDSAKNMVYNVHEVTGRLLSLYHPNNIISGRVYSRGWFHQNRQGKGDSIPFPTICRLHLLRCQVCNSHAT